MTEMNKQPIVTIEDIESKQFRLAARGYDQREVDEFLDSICDEIERLLGQLDQAERRIAYANAEARKAEAAGGSVRPAMSDAVSPYAAPKADQTADDAFKDILAMAQRVKEQTIKDAEDKANEIIANAREAAAARIGGLEEEKQRLETQVEAMKTSAREYKEKFAALLAAHKELLEQAEEL